MGHIYECIRLANKFKEKHNVEILFLVTSDSKIEKLEEENFTIKTLERNDFDSYIKEIKLFNPDIVFSDVLYPKEEYFEKLKDINTLKVSMEHLEESKSVNKVDIPADASFKLEK